MVRSARSLPNPEMAFLPPLFIMLGLLTLLVIAGHWLMKPAVLSNPGLAAYKPPTAAVASYGGAEQSLELERTARRVAEAENVKLQIQSTVLAQARSMEDSNRLAATAPQRKTAAVERRQDAPRTSETRSSEARIAQSEPASFAQRWTGSF